MAEVGHDRVDPALPRWLVLTDDREGAAARAVATAGSLPSVGQSPPSLTWSDVQDDWRAALGAHDLVVDLVAGGPDEGEAPRWTEVLLAGRSVLVRTAGDVALRVPVALGVAGRLPLAPSPDDVVAATRRLVEKAVDAPRSVARSWVARPARSEETVPRVLILAVSRATASQAAGSSLAVAGEGGRTVVATHSGVRDRIGALPASARVVEVPDPLATWWPVRLERLLLHRAPRTVVRTVRGAARLVARLRVVPPSRLASFTRSLDRVDAARARAVAAAERRAWNPVLVRVRPWRIARALAPELDLVDEIDLVVAADADTTALVWRLLRADPALESRAALKRVAMESVVRRRTERWVQRHPQAP